MYAVTPRRYNRGSMSLEPSIAAALASLQDRRDTIDRAITALRALDDSVDDDVGVANTENEIHRSTYPSPAAASFGGGADGARRVLRESPGRGFTAAELAEAMRANGWVTPSKNPRAAARAAANRLREDEDEHIFFEDGQYTYRPKHAELDFPPMTKGGA